MKILVTGASGFIGGSVVELLAQNPKNEIVATGRTLVSRFDGLENVTYQAFDLSGKLPEFDSEICIHCAGLTDDHATENQYFNYNILATENLLDGLKNCKLLIYISSSSVYDFKDGIVKKEEDAVLNHNLSLYGKSKLKAEEIVSNCPIPSKYILRPRAVYGKGDRVLMPRIQRLIKFDRLILPDKIARKSSLTHIQNLCDAIQKGIEKSDSGCHIYNIADKTTYSLWTIFEMILYKKCSNKRIISIPYVLLRIVLFILSKLKIHFNFSKQSLNYITQDSVLCIEKAEVELGYSGKYNFYEYHNSEIDT